MLVTHNTNKVLYGSYARSFNQMLNPPFDDFYDEAYGHYCLQLSLYQICLENIGLPEKAKRLSIPDPERSMSKRHLLLRLDDQGVAAVEDLASTNGTYVVRPDNRLIRLPAHQLLQLDESPVRLQLGDIGLELTRHNLPTAVQTATSTPVRQNGQTGTNGDAVSGTSHPASAADASAQTSASTPQTRPHGAVRTEPAVSDSSSVMVLSGWRNTSRTATLFLPS